MTFENVKRVLKANWPSDADGWDTMTLMETHKASLVTALRQDGAQDLAKKLQHTSNPEKLLKFYDDHLLMLDGEA